MRYGSSQRRSNNSMTEASYPWRSIPSKSTCHSTSSQSFKVFWMSKDSCAQRVCYWSPSVDKLAVAEDTGKEGAGWEGTNLLQLCEQVSRRVEWNLQFHLLLLCLRRSSNYSRRAEARWNFSFRFFHTFYFIYAHGSLLPLTSAWAHPFNLHYIALLSLLRLSLCY